MERLGNDFTIFTKTMTDTTSEIQYRKSVHTMFIDFCQDESRKAQCMMYRIVLRPTRRSC